MWRTVITKRYILMFCNSDPIVNTLKRRTVGERKRDSLGYG